MTTHHEQNQNLPDYAALIKYPRFMAIHTAMHRCQNLSILMAEPQCVSLQGVTGAGKSTLVRTYAAALPRREGPEGTEIPVLYVATPSPCTIKALAVEMLRQLGDPAAERGTLPGMNHRLIRLLIDTKVQLVVLDDFQHLVDPGTDKVLQQVSDWLKNVIKLSGTPFMVVGIPPANTRILRANPQLDRLFALRETLGPLPWDPKKPQTMAQFNYFVQQAETSIGMRLTNELPRAELLHRVHYATGGIVGHLMNLLRWAQALAEDDLPPRETIALPLLERAYTMRLGQLVHQQVNPFGSAAGTHFQAPPPQPPSKRGGASSAARGNPDSSNLDPTRNDAAAQGPDDGNGTGDGGTS